MGDAIAAIHFHCPINAKQRNAVAAALSHIAWPREIVGAMPHAVIMNLVVKLYQN